MNKAIQSLNLNNISDVGRGLSNTQKEIDAMRLGVYPAFTGEISRTDYLNRISYLLTMKAQERMLKDRLKTLTQKED